MNRTGWVWVVIIVLLIILIGWWYTSSHTASAPAVGTSAVTTNNTSAPSHDNIYLTESDPAKGNYMADFAAKTLYTFDKDSAGTTTCYGQCAKTWPPYTSGATVQAIFPQGISVIARADGTQQFAWNGMPLYYYSKDTAPNQINGDGFDGVWHIVKL